MLSQLHIENIAVISSTDINFHEGLNILTGETGAGKSIIIDSINMILGERASRDLIRTGKDKAIVEALFYISSRDVIERLAEMGIEVEEDGSLLISRELTSSGKNICRINGRMVTTTMLRNIGKFIVNIHGQHDNQELLQPDKHVEYLDRFGGEELLEAKKAYESAYRDFNNVRNEIKRLSGDDRERERKIDLLQFQLEEIENAKLKPGEEEELSEQRRFLSNAEKIISSVNRIYELLYTGGNRGLSVQDGFAEILKEFEEVVKYEPKLAEHYKNLEEIGYQIQEIAYDLRDYRDNFEYDQSMLESVEQRLDTIFKLKRKYGATIDEILEYRDKIKNELEEILSSEERLHELHKKLEDTLKILEEFGNKLSFYREKAASVLREKVMNELKELDMDKVQFQVDVKKQYNQNREIQFYANGCDKVEFLISTNPGEPLKPLIKIASGGELSRIMLAIKTVLADSDEVNTLIFDEIDTGVSGRAAQKIAEKLSHIGQKKQVLCITHLAQIASMADYHYLIEKNIYKEEANTTVKLLNAEKRKEELARIIGGAEITDLTLQHAEEMIQMADKLKQK